MADNEELVQLPRGQISVEKGPLQLITDFDTKFANGAKLKSFLRKNPGGVVQGAKAVTGSMNLMVGNDGDERDWNTYVDDGKIRTIVVKEPGGVRRTLKACFTEVGGKTSVEDGFVRAISFIGMWVKKPSF